MKNYLNVNGWRLSGKDAKKRRAKFRRQRITRGFSDWDWWDLDYFLCNLLAKSLRHYATHTIGWSMNLASTFEEYQERILHLADMFEEMANWEETHNPTEEDIKNGLNWYKENSAKLETLTKKAFAELGEVFWSLWD